MDLWSEKGFTDVILGIAAAILIFTYLLFFLGDIGEKYGRAEVKLGGKTFTVDVARERRELIRGLSGRDSIAEYGGMIFEFGRPDFYSIWMKGMHFSLDIIWLRRGRVVFAVENAAPPRPATADEKLEVFIPSENADEVLEVRAGSVARLGIQIGDEAEITFR